jgi:hypothetical protein
MKLRVYQALYGERQKAHTFLNASPDTPEICKEIRPLTDRPGYVPPGIDWMPYLSGFSFKQFYVFSRTFPDVHATRPGMVFTHCLIIDIDDVVRCSDITQILRLLLEEPIKDTLLETLDIDVSENQINFQSYPEGFINLLSQIIKYENGNSPVVWIGQEGFEQALTTLWNYLWSSSRRAMKFRLSFDPQDVEEQQLNLVYTPNQLAAKWRSFSTVKSSDTDRPLTLVAQYILGIPSGAPLRELITQLSVEPSSFSELTRIERCHQYILSLDRGEADCDAIRSLARTLGTISASPNQGKELKAKVIQSLANATLSGEGRDVLALRNFDVGPYSSGASIVGDAISAWVRSAFTQSPEVPSEVLSEIVDASFAQPLQPKWSQAVHSGLRDAFDNWSANTAAKVWDVWALQSDINRLGDCIPITGQIDKALALATPSNLGTALGESVSKFALKSRMGRLYAAALTVTYDPDEAILRFLELTDEQAFDEGSCVLIEEVSGEHILALALSGADERLIDLAANVCRSNSVFLQDLDPTAEVWRAIWLRTIQLGSPVWMGITDSTSVLHTVLDLRISGTPIEEELIEAIGSTPEASLLMYPNRAALWDTLSKTLRVPYVEKTAARWLDEFFSGSAEQIDFDRVLEQEIIRQFVMRWDPFFDNATHLLLTFSQNFVRFREDDFNVAFDKFLDSKQPLKVLDGRGMGRLFERRRWSVTVNRVFTIWRYGKRDELHAILEESKSLLGIFKWIELSLSRGYDSTISANDFWAALNELAVDLYQWGPDEKDIWSRAGGEYSSVRSGNGKEKWRDALNDLRRGGGGKDISVERLLDKMLADYPRNDNLKLIRESHRELLTK